MLPYLNVLKSDDGKLRLKGSFFDEDYSEKKSVPENIVKIRRKVKERWNRRTLHRRRMKKKIQRVSISYIIVIIENIYHFISLYIQTLGVSIPISVPSRCLRGLWRN